MSFPFNEIEFKRNAVQPVECIKAGWELIRSQYWLFVGMTVVGILIGSVVPLGILMGPMMCGIYLALFQTRRGQPIEFGLLFKGFDYFGDAVIATLLHMVPLVIVIAPAYILYIVGMFGMMASSQNGEPNPGAMLGFLGVFAVVWLVIMVLLLVGINRRAAAVLIGTGSGTLLMVAICAVIGIRVNFLDFIALPITLVPEVVTVSPSSSVMLRTAFAKRTRSLPFHSSRSFAGRIWIK